MAGLLPRRRTERTLVGLRALVTALVALHVALVAEALSAEGLLGVAIGACGALAASTALSCVAPALHRRGPIGLLASWTVVVIDAVALVTTARVTVDIDPAATLAWAFVLWVPFSVAVRARPGRTLAASFGVAAAVWISIRSEAGALDPVAATWTSVGVPILLVLVAGVTTAFTTRSHHRSGSQVERKLFDERDRALRLREADELKNTFLAAVSHELRTPLTSILGFSLTLLDRPELDDAQRDRMLRMVVTEAEHLEGILDNLLDLDRLTRGKATLAAAEVDPARVVQAAVDHARRRSGRPVQTDLQQGLRMSIDSAKVERIVENLVGNAIKYTPDDAAITVTMRQERDGVRIRVDDTGPGIPDDLRESIFEPFRRGDVVGVPGTGIGLSLVDRFSRLHGGHATVGDSPGGGCRFDVYLPSSGTPLRTLDEEARGQQSQFATDRFPGGVTQG